MRRKTGIVLLIAACIAVLCAIAFSVGVLECLRAASSRMQGRIKK